MQGTNKKIVKSVGQFIVGGAWGELLVSADTGNVLQYKPQDGNHYENIARFDVPEYVQYNGGVDDTDILLIGYWDVNGTYEPADANERKERGEHITLRYKKKEQKNFVNELVGAVLQEILQKIDGDIPAEWDGHELRRFIADKFEAQTTPLTPKRKREYRNAVLVNNL